MLCTTNAVFAQSTKTAPSPFDTDVNCPAGTCPTITISLDIFNFHKPRTACTTGFGLCVKLSTAFSCNPCFGKTSISTDKVSSWIKLTATTAELHIPIALKDAKGFEKTDMTTFQIDDNTLSFIGKSGTQKSAKGGIYPVAKDAVDYIIKLDLN